MEEKCESNAYFFIEGFPAITEITELMGIPPTNSWLEGDPDPKPFLPDFKRESSCWEISSPLPKEEMLLDAHISALLDILEPSKHAIEELHKKYQVGITCVVYYRNANPSFRLSAKLIKRCADLELPLNVELFSLECIDEELAYANGSLAVDEAFAVDEQYDF